MVNDIAKESWAGCKIEEVIALRVARLVDLGQSLPNLGVEIRIMKFAAYIKNSLDHPIAEFGINRAGGKLIKIIAHDLLILFAGVVVAAHAEDREVRRK